MRTIEVNLNEDPADRWEVLKPDQKVLRRLVKKAVQQSGDPGWVLKSAMQAMLTSPYYEDLHAIAERYEVPYKDLAWLHSSYELAHAWEWSGSWLTSVFQPFGCTTGAYATPHGVTHVRTLDWPVSALKKASRLFHYKIRRGHFKAVGFPGFVGVLTGMRPNAFSVSLNYAPPVGLPKWNRWSPVDLIRYVLEECRSYKDAVRLLSRELLSVSAFFVVAGRGRMCVIERLPSEYYIRASDVRVVQANHFSEDGPFTEYNATAGDYLEDSILRGASLDKKLLRRVHPIRALRDYPVINESTVHAVALRPSLSTVTIC